MVGTARHPVLVASGLAAAGFGFALCITPITSLAMASVEPARAGMASGIMSAQRAIGSTLGFAVMGSILSAWLGATLDSDLAAVVKSPTERAQIAQEIIRGANPRAHIAEIGPAAPIPWRDDVHDIAEADFVTGIRVALSSGMALLAIVFVAGLAWFPRGRDAMARDAQREATAENKP
jgi:hypothetical protein